MLRLSQEVVLIGTIPLRSQGEVESKEMRVILVLVYVLIRKVFMFMKDVKYAGLIDGYNHKIHWEGEIIGTIVPQNSRFGFTNGYKILEDEDNTDTDNRQ